MEGLKLAWTLALLLMRAEAANVSMYVTAHTQEGAKVAPWRILPLLEPTSLHRLGGRVAKSG